MTQSKLFQVLGAALLAILLGAPLRAVAPGATVSASSAEAAPEDRPRLTIERLYSLPSLIGTAPGGFAWSADGRRLAFLWNDEGYPFRDVWMVDVGDPELAPRRLTRLPRSTGPRVSERDPVAAAAAQERLERDVGVRSVLWHPGGELLLVGFDGDLWLLAPASEPRRVTETVAPEAQAAFSPDGATLAFLREGDLWSLPVDAAGASGGRTLPVATRLTEVSASGVELTAFEWSPDGSRVKVIETDSRGVPQRGIPDYLATETTLDLVPRPYPGEKPVKQKLGLVAAGGGEIEWLTLSEPEPDMILGSHWSPDGSWLAVDTCDLYAKDREIYTVELEADRAARVVAADRDPLNETFYFWRIAWSADSEWLYFLSDRDEDYHVYAVRPAVVGGLRRMTRGPWAVAEMHPVPGGLVVVGNQGRAEERHLFRVPDAGGVVRLSRRAGTHSPVLSPDGRYAAALFSNDETPPDLFLSSVVEPAEERRVTSSPLAAFDRYQWSRPRYVTFPSHVDGTTLYGRLTLPADFDPSRSYPAVLGSVYTNSVRNQWGGRVAHPTWGLDHYLAQEGYVLFNVDMRGSWGRGREHRRGIRLDYGGMDIEDLESGVRFLAEQGYVDMDRVGIWGSSYGGLMTAMSLFRKPGLYAAGVAGAPATNVRHALTGQMAVMMRPSDQPAEYDDSSPYLHAAGLTDPLMIIHGMRDRVVLFKDSVTLVQRLILLGKEVELVALPNSGHGWDAEGLAQTRFAFKKLVAHFDRHLKGQ